MLSFSFSIAGYSRDIYEVKNCISQNSLINCGLSVKYIIIAIISYAISSVICYSFKDNNFKQPIKSTKNVTFHKITRINFKLSHVVNAQCWVKIIKTTVLFNFELL